MKKIKTLKEYKKKYKYSSRLLFYSKKELEKFANLSEHHLIDNYYLLNGKKWVLIGETFYQIPRFPSLSWFKGLHIGVKIASCVLLGGAVVAGSTYGVIKIVENNTHTYEPTIPESVKGKIRINLEKVEDNGNAFYKVIGTQSSIEAGNNVVDIESVTIGGKNLELTSEYVVIDKTINNIEVEILSDAFNKYVGPVVITPRITNTPYIKDIQIKNLPSKTEYESGENINLTGLEIESVYNTGEKKVLESSEYTTYPDASVSLRHSMSSVTVTHTSTGKKLIFSIKVNPGTIQTISVTENPAKTTYNEGEYFSSNGLKVTATLSDGDTLDVTNKCVTNYDGQIISQAWTGAEHLTEEQTVTVSVKDQPTITSTFKITVNRVYKAFTISGDRNVDIESSGVQYSCKEDLENDAPVTWSVISGDDLVYFDDDTPGLLKIKEDEDGLRHTGTAIIQAQSVLNTDKKKTYEIEVGGFKYLDFTDLNMVEASTTLKNATADSINLEIPKRIYNEETGSFDVVRGLKENAFKDCKALKSVKLLDSFAELPVGCFDGCTNITKVNIEKNIATLPVKCFNGCSKLTTLTGLKDSDITSIGSECFKGCTALTNIELPDYLINIFASAFESSGLISLELPSEVESIGVDAFKGCTSLTTVIANNSYVANLTEDNAATKTCLFDNCSEIKVKSAVTVKSTSSLEVNFFKVDDEEDRHVYKKVNSISLILDDVKIDYDVGETFDPSNIKVKVFHGTTLIGTVTDGFEVVPPTEMTTISNRTITVKYKGVQTTYTIAVNKLAKYTYTGYTTNSLGQEVLATNENDVSYYYVKCNNYDVCTKAVIPASYNDKPVKGLSNNCFTGDGTFTGSKLKTVVYKDKTLITYIGSRAFFYCRALSAIEIPPNVTALYERCFGSLENKNLTINIPENLRTINSRVFCDANLKKITFSNEMYWEGMGASAGQSFNTYYWTDLQWETGAYNKDFCRDGIHRNY